MQNKLAIRAYAKPAVLEKPGTLLTTITRHLRVDVVPAQGESEKEGRDRYVATFTELIGEHPPEVLRLAGQRILAKADSGFAPAPGVVAREILASYGKLRIAWTPAAHRLAQLREDDARYEWDPDGRQRFVANTKLAHARFQTIDGRLGNQVLDAVPEATAKDAERALFEAIRDLHHDAVITDLMDSWVEQTILVAITRLDPSGQLLHWFDRKCPPTRSERIYRNHKRWVLLLDAEATALLASIDSLPPQWRGSQLALDKLYNFLGAGYPTTTLSGDALLEVVRAWAAQLVEPYQTAYNADPLIAKFDTDKLGAWWQEPEAIEVLERHGGMTRPGLFHYGNEFLIDVSRRKNRLMGQAFLDGLGRHLKSTGLAPATD